MKLSTQEEYGLRCLLQIARLESSSGESVTINAISQAEGLSVANVGKFVRALRLGGFVDSERGHLGGYRLARPATEISVRDVLDTLGGKLFDAEFCEEHSGAISACTHSAECSVRSLWNSVQFLVDQLLNQVSLHDMLGSEQALASCLSEQAEVLLQVAEIEGTQIPDSESLSHPKI
jgi:Rrf2 family iron-sulfur cluster assembly transcriptional regulator